MASHIRVQEVTAGHRSLHTLLSSSGVAVAHKKSKLINIYLLKLTFFKEDLKYARNRQLCVRFWDKHSWTCFLCTPRRSSPIPAWWGRKKYSCWTEPSWEVLRSGPISLPAWDSAIMGHGNGPSHCHHQAKTAPPLKRRLFTSLSFTHTRNTWWFCRVTAWEVHASQCPMHSATYTPTCDTPLCSLEVESLQADMWMCTYKHTHEHTYSSIPLQQHLLLIMPHDVLCQPHEEAA